MKKRNKALLVLAFLTVPAFCLGNPNALANEPPVIACFDSILTVVAGNTLEFDIYATDPDTDDITLSFVSMAPVPTISPTLAYQGDSTWTFSWTTVSGDEGLFTAWFLAQDEHGAEDICEVKIAVLSSDSVAFCTWDFQTPEGEPYPFDVTISDGDWMQQFDGVTHIAAEVPDSATYILVYNWTLPNGNMLASAIRITIAIDPGRAMSFEGFAYHPDSLSELVRLYIAYREVGADDTLSFDWNPATNVLRFTLSTKPNKIAGMYAIINEDGTERPIYAAAAIPGNKAEVAVCVCTSTKTDSCGYIITTSSHVHIEKKPEASLSVSDSIAFVEIDSSEGAFGIYAQYHNYALIENVGIRLYDIMTGESSDPEFYYPQYAETTGHYLVELLDLPSQFAVFDLPILFQAGNVQAPTIYLSKTEALQLYTFSRTVEDFFAKSSYSNLSHAVGDSITVDVSTDGLYDWWGSFTLPTHLAVSSLFAYSDTKGVEELSELYDFTINHIEGSELFLVVVRIQPNYDRLKLTYSPRRQSSVLIPNSDCVNPGEHVCLPILLDNNTTEFGGFELEVEFDYTAMTFVGAEPGELIEGFEKFTYRLLPCPACGCCKYKILLFGLYDIPNGVENIGDPIPMTPPGEYGELVNLCFVVNNDENLRGLKIPVCWEWEGTVVNDTLVEDWECGENTFSSWSGDTLFTSNLLCQFNPEICDDPGDRIQPILIFQHGICGQNCGGVDICPAGPGLCKRGDINMNDMTHEVADAVLFASYFVEGTVVFRYDKPYQICATDVNADGRTLTLSDLVYLIRVILHDAVEIPKLTPSSDAVNITVSGNSVRTECAVPIGAILFEFDGAVNPTLLADMEMLHKDNKVLVWSSKGKSFSTGEVLTFEGESELVTATAVDRDSRELTTAITGKVAPTTFALHPAYPNPFNPFTTLSFTLPENVDYSLKIYNVAGQLVRTYEGLGSVGLNMITWDSKDNTGVEVASGVYFYKLTAGGFSATEKMVILK